VANINASVDGQLGTGRSLYTETEKKKGDAEKTVTTMTMWEEERLIPG
jgi:hypothetical protein